MSDTDTKSAQDKAPDSKTAGRIPFNENIEIVYGQPLALYNKGKVRAYAAEGRGKAPKNLIAYICEDTLSPRIVKTETYNSIINPNIIRLVAAGTAYWQPDNRKHYILIYEHNLGKPLAINDTNACLGLKPDMIITNILRPLISALLDIRNKDLVHGEIRLGNLFDGGSSNYERIILGDCLSLPPSYGLPAIYEPAERAMADPIGKGIGVHSDDLYSLGVCLAMLVRHSDPTEGMSVDDVIESKLEVGSFTTLVGRDRLTGPINELLRGLLQDDPLQRWTLEEIEEWMDGRRQSPKPGTKRYKARRPLIFNGGKYVLPEILGKDLPKNVSQTVQIVQNGELEQWLNRALEDNRVEERYIRVQNLMQEMEAKANYEEKLTSLHALILNPNGPVFYGGLKLTPPGYGNALSEAYMTKKHLQPFLELLESRIMVEWLDAQPAGKVDVSALFGKIDSCRIYLRQKQAGAGLERVIYVLNPDCPCLSEKVIDHYVRSPEDMMEALEEISQSLNRPIHLFDPHIIAFLSVKDRQNIDPYFFELNHDMVSQRIMGELKTLATIQKRSRLGMFPGIAKWIESNLDHVYERIHDRELREQLRRQIEGPIRKGDLGKMAAILDDAKTRKNDYNGFRLAMNEYNLLARESAKLDYRLENDRYFGRDTGKMVAATISCAISVLLILLSVYLTFYEPFR